MKDGVLFLIWATMASCGASIFFGSTEGFWGMSWRVLLWPGVLVYRLLEHVAT